MDSTARPAAIDPGPASGRPEAQRPEQDFLPDPFPAPRLPARFDPAGHQRLLVNPFLGLGGLIAWAWLFRRLLAGREPPLALAACLLLAWLPFLVHYHCIDCGATGIWHRWRRHACPRVIDREARGLRGWLRWPRPTTQLVVWLYLLGGVTVLITLLRLGVSPRRG